MHTHRERKRGLKNLIGSLHKFVTSNIKNLTEYLY